VQLFSHFDLSVLGQIKRHNRLCYWLPRLSVEHECPSTMRAQENLIDTIRELLLKSF
jgi:hypothetical protein